MDTITASWVGKAAYALIDKVELGGKEANRIARDLAFELLDYDVDIGTIDPRVYALRHFDLAKDEPLHIGIGNRPDSSWVQLQRNIRNCWRPSNGPQLPTDDDLMEDWLP